jgi:hypothetical protein
MQTGTTQSNHFAHLFGGAVVEDALRKAEGWKLKSRVCRPLDSPRRRTVCTPADLARFDAEIDAEATAEAE